MRQSAILLRPLIVVALFLVLISDRSVTQADEKIEWPPIGNDREIVNYLLSIEREVPSLFDDLVEFDVDLFHILEQQRAINKGLAHDPRFRKALTEHPDRQNIEITVYPKGGGEVQVDAEALGKLRAEAVQALHGVSARNGEPNIKAAIRAGLVQEAAIWPGLNTNAYLVGLAKALAPEEMKKVLALPASEKLAFFVANLPTDGVQKGFAGGKLPFDVTALNRETALQMARELVGRDEKISQLSLLGGLLEGASEVPDLKTAEAESLLRELQPAQLAAVGEKEAYQKILNRLFSRHAEQAQAAQAVVATGADSGVKRLKLVLGKGDAIAKPVLKLTLEEQPPPMSWTKGLVANESTTKNAAAYVNTPEDRVWYIRDGKKVAPGFVGGARVEIDGKPAFRLFALNGQRVGADYTDAIVQGLYAARKKLGFEVLAFPPPTQIPAAYNYAPIADHMAKLTDGQALVPVKFHDGELREKLGEYVPHAYYESVENNGTAIVYQPREEHSAFRVTVEVKAAPPFHLPIQEVDVAKALGVALQIETSGKRDTARRFLRVVGMEDKTFEEVKRVLFNPLRDPVDTYLKKASTELAKHGVTLDPAFKNTKILPYYLGLMRASDGFSEKNLNQALNGVVEHLTYLPDPDALKSLISEHRQAILASPKVQGFMTKLAKVERGGGDLAEVWNRFSLFSELGIGLSDFPKAKENFLKFTEIKNYTYRDYHVKLAAVGVMIDDVSTRALALRELMLILEESKGHDGRINEILTRVLEQHPESLDTIHKLGAAPGATAEMIRGVRLAVHLAEEHAHSLGCGAKFHGIQ